jgi:hypothetical protein
MKTEPRYWPVWMPPAQTISAVPAGRWWDAVVVPQTLGLDALQLLDTTSGHCPGPVIREPYTQRPRLYFLVPKGTAQGWDVPGVVALGVTAYIGIPGPTTLEPPGPHWLCPPDPDDPESLVDAVELERALRAVQGVRP